ncbi:MULTISPECIES: hypothetical protein [Pseudidiomarina]|uniref:Uncharacterized protein n=2 Tax=Pseudidiomarina TaxID=2800384 RepID=A0A0K6H6V8_9GAMM|nr:MULTISPECIES: hypothetical protein [Pseudidiomarina]RUO49210.1 hypothetical protein CWE24_01505 [Pseudidiomarina donghaiensis]CUA86726.1 hypothetical protein Ga0061064_1596 [Pseudidiomarina woesei]SFV20756.1 hypothetical protein SAMN04488139_0435 [Pseudidiomarina donghaiensis]
MKVLTLTTLVAAAMITSGATAAQANEANQGNGAPMQVYSYVYSPERAVGSLYHSFDAAAHDISRQAGASAKADSIASIKAGYDQLKQQFAYVIYVPKKPQGEETIDWRGFA